MSRNLFVANQSTGYLTIDIVNAFVKSKKYDKIVLAAGNEINPALHLDTSVYVQKITLYDNQSIKTRAITWFKGTFNILFLLWFKYRKYDLFLFSNPTTISFISYFIKRKFSVMVYDIFPEATLKTGKLTEKSFLYRLWFNANKRFYRKAQYVYTLTDDMAYEISNSCPREKIEIVPLWGDSNLPLMRIDKKDNLFRQKYGLLSKFVVMYSGNIGRGHDLECIADVANELKDIKDICFVFVGEGYSKKILQEKAKEYALDDTMLFLPFQPHEMLQHSLSAPDLALVSTNRTGGKHGIPSKTFNSIRLGCPIACLAEPDSAIAKFVNTNHIGVSFRYCETKSFADFIKKAYYDRTILDQYKDNLESCAAKHTNKLAELVVK